MKPQHYLSAVAMLAAPLAGWFAEPQQSFDQRWPVAMPSAMPLQMFNAARKASVRPSFCQWNYPGTACRLS